MSSYPGSIDTIPSVATGDIVQASLENCQTTAILAVENTLGINPQGSFPSVAALLASTVTAGSLQSGALVTGTDTGTTNAYAVSLTPTPPTYSAGQTVVFVAGTTNTGAATLSVNGQTAINLLKNGTTPLAAGDIQAGQVVTATYDGRFFQTTIATSGSSSQPVVANTVNELRLTLVSGTPIVDDSLEITTTTIYWTPYTGNRVALYDPTFGWSVYSTSELSVDISSLSTGLYDLFAFSDGGTPALQAGTVWTDNSTRAVPLSIQDGVYVNSTDPTQRYLGTFFTDGGVVDFVFSRCLYNATNRIPRVVYTYAGPTSTNSSTFEIIAQVPFVLGLANESVSAWATAFGAGDGVSAACELTISYDFDGGSDGVNGVSGTIGESCIPVSYTRFPQAIGLLSLVLWQRSSVDGTTVNLYDDGAGSALTNLMAMVWL